MSHSRMVLICLFLLANGFSHLPGSDYPTEKTKTIIERQSFPWYDKGTGDFRPVETPKTRSIDWEDSGPEKRLLFDLPRLLFWAALLVAAGTAVTLLVRHGLPVPEKDQDPTRQEKSWQESDRLEALPQAVRQSGDLLQRATELFDSGRPGEAILFFHSWQLLQLDKMGKIELQKGKTNRQYLLEISAEPGENAEVVRVFSESTRLFEDAYFGALEISGESFAAVWNQRTIFSHPTAKAAVGP